MKNNIQNSIQYVSSKFQYKHDTNKKLGDHWFVMKEREGEYQGDCEDFTITILWWYFGCSIWNMFWGLLTGKAKIHRVKAINGYHVVGQVGDVWFDNWTLKGLSKDKFFSETKHQYLKRYYFMLPYFFILGYFKGR